MRIDGINASIDKAAVHLYFLGPWHRDTEVRMLGVMLMSEEPPRADPGYTQRYDRDTYGNT